MKLKICLVLGLVLSVAAGGVVVFMPRLPRAAPPGAERPPEPARADDRLVDPLPEGAVARLGTLRFRLDTTYVRQLAFAPDGKTLAAAASEGLWLFDAATGKQKRVIRSPGTEFQRVVFSADGERLLAEVVVERDGSRKYLVQVWDAADGRKTSECELKNVLWLGWSPEGRPLAACRGEGEINLHDIAAGRKRRFFARDLPSEPFIGCFCAAGGDVLAAAAGDGKGFIRVWGMSNDEEGHSLKADGGVMEGPAVSPDGGWLAVVFWDAGDKKAVQLWDLTTGHTTQILTPNQKELAKVVFAPDGHTLATVGRTDIRFWDTATGRERGRIESESTSVAISPDGKTLAIAGPDSGAIHLWDVASGKRKPEPEGHTNRPIALSFSPDGKRLATCDGTIFIWDTENGEPLVRIRRSAGACDCAFSADGQTLYSCWRDGTLRFDDAASGRERHALNVEKLDRQEAGEFLSLHLSEDRRRLIVVRAGDFFETRAKRNMLLTGWDAATRQQLFRRERVHGVTFWSAVSPDARTLAPQERLDAKALDLEDLATGEPVRTIPGLEGLPMTFSPDARLLVSLTERQLTPKKREIMLRLREVLTGRELLALPPEGLCKSAFSPDGHLLAAATPPGEIILWDLIRWGERRRFHGFNAEVTSLAFSPDGRRLVSGLSDSTLLVWDVGAPPTVPVSKPGPEAIARAWANLAGADALRAFRARWELASAPQQALSLMKEHLRPAQAADAQRVSRLLADLESEQFAVRQKAQTELEALGDLAEPALRKTLANRPSLEVRRRAEAMLDHLRGPVTRPEVLRALRAVAVLEDIGTPAARRLLEELSKGAPEARLTREARGALRRLALRFRPSRARSAAE